MTREKRATFQNMYSGRLTNLASIHLIHKGISIEGLIIKPIQESMFKTTERTDTHKCASKRRLLRNKLTHTPGYGKIATSEV